MIVQNKANFLFLSSSQRDRKLKKEKKTSFLTSSIHLSCTLSPPPPQQQPIKNFSSSDSGNILSPRDAWPRISYGLSVAICQILGGPARVKLVSRPADGAYPSQLPPTGNGNVSIMAVVDDRSRENAKYPGEGGRRGRKRRGGGSRCILSRPIYIYIPAPISRHSICPRVNLVDRSPTINLATVDSNLLPPWAARGWGWGVGGVEKKRWARCD